MIARLLCFVLGHQPKICTYRLKDNRRYLDRGWRECQRCERVLEDDV
jgi:hypothetical protein